MILLLYPRRRIEEWVESNLPSLTAPHSSWVGLRLENSNLNLASRRLTQPLAVSSFSVQQPSHSESLVRAGWLMGQLSRGTFCQGEGSSLLPAQRCQGHHGKHTHTHPKALKHGVGGGEWEGAGGTCTRAEHRDSRVWSNLLTSSTPSSPVFLPGVKASVRFLPLANHTHTHSPQPRQCTFILACPCSSSQHQKFTESPIPWTSVTSDGVNITQAQLRWCR